MTDFEEILPCVRAEKADEKTEEFVRRELSACDGNSSERIAKIVTDFLKKENYRE